MASPRALTAWPFTRYTLTVSLLKSASTVSLWTLASRITGLVRELLIASAFGASALTDAFNVAFRIPNLFRRLFAEGAFSQAFVPVLAASKAQNGDAATQVAINHVATLLAWALLLLSILGVAAAPFLVWAMASGLQQQPDSYAAAVQMTRWMFPYIAFMSLVALSAGILNTWKRFAVPAATPVLLNLSMIGAAWWLAPWFKLQGIQPIFALPAGVMLGGVLQLSLQIPALVKLGLLPRIGVTWQAIQQAWNDPASRQIASLMLPALLGVGVAQISLLINTQIASHLAPGSVSWLTYADRLMEFPTAILGVALGAVLMPQLAAARANGDQAEYGAMLDWGLRLVLLLALPCAVALLTFSQPLISVLYHYGAFTDQDVKQTTMALTGYGVGLLGLVAIKVLAPGYYASQDIKTPVKIAVIVLCFTQLLNLVLVPYLAHAGLALSIGLGALLNATWLYVGLVKKGRYTPLPGWGLFGAKVLVASLVLAGFLTYATHQFDWLAGRQQALFRLGMMALVLISSAALYFGCLRISGLRLKSFLRR
ncbi:MAG: putative peptidoglycan biosynthesis protein MurJ [Pseudomonadota bacterium]